YSCNIQKTKSEIIYFLPASVTEILNKEIKKRNKEDKDVGLVLDKEGAEVYIIYISTVSNSSKRFWLKYSNRSAFIQGSQIPLYFEMDESFSSPEKGKVVLKKIETDEGIKKTFHNREHAFKVKFKRDGEILEN
ncbi:hypothetical protein, partial [Chryseobacterium sp. SN22]|uniref:hypothetical protein n=1 Tax=Chryseobacterium sp. SN22 TaxID=2606431 RepID=UPI001E2D95EE